MTSLDRHDPLPPALLLMQVVSGFVDAICFLALGQVFTANITGTVVLIGLAFAGAPGFSANGCYVSLAAFIVGAVAAGRLNSVFSSRRTHLLVVLAAEATLLAAATVTAAFLGVSGFGGRGLVIAFLALAMGSWNGTLHGLGVPVLTSTTVTRTLTQLAAESSLAGGDDPRAARRAAKAVCLTLGAYPGALLVRHGGVCRPLLVAVVFVALIAIGYAAYPSSHSHGGPPRPSDQE